MLSSFDLKMVNLAEEIEQFIEVLESSVGVLENYEQDRNVFKESIGKERVLRYIFTEISEPLETVQNSFLGLLEKYPKDSDVYNNLNSNVQSIQDQLEELVQSLSDLVVRVTAHSVQLSSDQVQYILDKLNQQQTMVNRLSQELESLKALAAK